MRRFPLPYLKCFEVPEMIIIIITSVVGSQFIFRNQMLHWTAVGDPTQ